MKKICKMCECEFETRAANKLTCSPTCKRERMNEILRQKRTEKRQGESCAVCGFFAVSDIHHDWIGKYILCPNHHAMITRKKATLKTLLSRSNVCCSCGSRMDTNNTHNGLYRNGNPTCFICLDDTLSHLEKEVKRLQQINTCLEQELDPDCQPLELQVYQLVQRVLRDNHQEDLADKLVDEVIENMERG